MISAAHPASDLAVRRCSTPRSSTAAVTTRRPRLRSVVDAQQLPTAGKAHEVAVRVARSRVRFGWGDGSWEGAADGILVAAPRREVLEALTASAVLGAPASLS